MKIESLKFEGVSFTHEGQEPIIHNVEFDFPMNEILWVKAEEGAGKSSLLQILGGLQIPQSGQYLINGENVVDMSFEEFLPYRLQIGYSFDYGGLINNRTLYDNLMLPLLYHKAVSQKEAKERVDEMIRIFDIGKFANERPAHVPGRVRKLTCLMRSLVMRPQVLLLDDPSVGLGQDSVYTFVDYVHQLRKEGCLNHVFISSYDEKFMNLMNYQIIHLDEGQLYFQAVDPEKRVVHL
ncbi:cell division ATP-binding protein FtsE [Bdellovibrio sp. NC01]|uniref:cell division ATP-binding protein FtsE n=1 Tax=Bdellovibrio sp. NC01 TaxID=2220073 RepID=UPI00115BAD60|nr:ATP-binding cassette domain-containing protein [Bdellovibrio sp. NC01]QDK37606.1 ABC transporter ATP-binding protein [Bdellovibrio sp. NC01]